MAATAPTASTIQVSDVQTLLDYHASRGQNPDFITKVNYDHNGAIEGCEINAEYSADVAFDSSTWDTRSVATFMLQNTVDELLKKEPKEKTLRYNNHIMDAKAFQLAISNRELARNGGTYDIEKIFTNNGRLVVESQQSSQAEASQSGAVREIDLDSDADADADGDKKASSSKGGKLKQAFFRAVKGVAKAHTFIGNQIDKAGDSADRALGHPLENAAKKRAQVENLIKQALPTKTVPPQNSCKRVTV